MTHAMGRWRQWPGAERQAGRQVAASIERSLLPDASTFSGLSNEPRSRTTTVGTRSYLAACAGSSRLARGITGLACCCWRLPAPPLLLLLLQTAIVCWLLPLLAAVTDLCAPPSPQAHGRHQSGVRRRPGH